MHIMEMQLEEDGVCGFAAPIALPSIAASGPVAQASTQTADLSHLGPDDECFIGVFCGTLTGTAPTLTFSLETQPLASDPATDPWYEAAITSALGSAASTTIQLGAGVLVGQRVRLMIIKAAADNATTTAAAELFSSRPVTVS